MKKLAKRTIGITLAIAFAITTTLLALLATIYLVAYMKNLGV